jgi:hypothetical protein
LCDSLALICRSSSGGMEYPQAHAVQMVKGSIIAVMGSSIARRDLYVALCAGLPPPH